MVTVPIVFSFAGTIGHDSFVTASESTGGVRDGRMGDGEHERHDVNLYRAPQADVRVWTTISVWVSSTSEAKLNIGSSHPSLSSVTLSGSVVLPSTARPSAPLHAESNVEHLKRGVRRMLVKTVVCASVLRVSNYCTMPETSRSAR